LWNRSKLQGINQALRISFVKDRSSHNRRHTIDSSKIKRELGLKPSVGSEEGLERTIDWYLNDKQWVTSILSGKYKQCRKNLCPLGLMASLRFRKTM